MIFSSPEFIFAFLPIVFLISWAIRRLQGRTMPLLVWLTMSSFFFYGFWEASYLPIILASIAFNWLIARWIEACGDRNRTPLFIGIALNLLAIGYYKYLDFLTGTVNALASTEIPEMGLLLPLGISFFTFQQIAYLVDTARGETSRANLLEYAFFVSFFPQLIAGPIVHHRHVLPAIRKGEAFHFRAEEILRGLHAFSIGFAKKVVLADTLAIVASNVFDAADAGQTLNGRDAMLGTLAYTFQIYFDFSGYTDMAIGIGLMFGVKLPRNFNSPYKAVSIADFWRRWHITLSEFLRDYVYIPLGGNRKGGGRRYLNLLSTMFIGGLWHGASWTFVAWGVAHGLMLAANHAYGRLLPSPQGSVGQKLLGFGGWLFTFVLVALAWVAFRATSWSGMWEIYEAIFTLRGPLLQGEGSYSLAADDLDSPWRFRGWLWCAMISSGVVAFLLPNTWQLMERFDRDRGWYRHFANTLTIVCFVSATYLVLYMSNRVTEFIYFNF